MTIQSARRFFASMAVFAIGMAALAGCGGGGTSVANVNGAGNSNDAEATRQFGPLITRVAGTVQPPVTSGGSGSVITGVAGGNFSSLTLVSPKLTSLNSTTLLQQSTRIAIDIGGAVVYTMNPDGTGQTRLTTNTLPYGYGCYPTWSPDGTQIAYCLTDNDTGRSQIFVMNADGTNPHRISNGASYDFTPAWSPHGDSIAFTRQGAHYQIFTMNPDGTNVKHLSDATAKDFQPAWSPDAAMIAFVRHVVSVNHDQIWMMHADGSGPFQLSANFTGGDMGYPAYSPDGNALAFSYFTGIPPNGADFIYTMALGSGYSQQLTNSNVDQMPAWSPDGTHIVFQRTDSSNQTNIFVAPTDGTSPPSQLTNFNSFSVLSPAWSPYPASRNIVGTHGMMGTSAAGFLLGQKGEFMSSLVVFNSGTPSRVGISTQTGISSGESNYVFIVADPVNLTNLSYINGPFGSQTVVIGGGGSNAISGASAALVTFDAQNGTVNAVLPYTAATKSAQASPTPQRQGNVLTYRRTFLGVWDGGKNVAPHGASEVRIDAATGKLLGYR